MDEMKRFALLSNIMGNIFSGWDYVAENFDFHSFKNSETLDFLKLYELIWIYAGVEDSSIIKRVEGSNPSAKILYQIDNDGGGYGLTNYVKVNIVPYVTALARITPRDWVGVRNYYLQIPRDKGPWWSMEMMRPYKVHESEKQDYGAMMFHSGGSLFGPLTAVKEAGFKVKLFANYHGVPATQNQNMLDKMGLCGSMAYTRLPEQEYLRELSKCRWAIEDPNDYLGFSRFVIECATMGVPVVGGEQIYSVKIGFPETCTEHMDIPRQVALIKTLSNDPALCKRIGDAGYGNLLEHLSNERCTQALLDAMKDMGINL